MSAYFVLGTVLHVGETVQERRGPVFVVLTWGRGLVRGLEEREGELHAIE